MFAAIPSVDTHQLYVKQQCLVNQSLVFEHKIQSPPALRCKHFDLILALRRDHKCMNHISTAQHAAIVLSRPCTNATAALAFTQMLLDQHSIANDIVMANTFYQGPIRVVIRDLSGTYLGGSVMCILSSASAFWAGLTPAPCRPRSPTKLPSQASLAQANLLGTVVDSLRSCQEWVPAW